MSAEGLEHALVLAKAPVAGRVKTRLQGAFAPDQVATLAEAALRDTMEAIRSCRASRRLVALDGEPGPWLGAGIETVPQEPGSFAQRLDRAW
jgi:glycosyltransferase A (GT-A) superfamily protein (DUF2064 family)